MAPFLHTSAISSPTYPSPSPLTTRREGKKETMIGLIKGTESSMPLNRELFVFHAAVVFQDQSLPLSHKSCYQQLLPRHTAYLILDF